MDRIFFVDTRNTSGLFLKAHLSDRYIPDDGTLYSMDTRNTTFLIKFLRKQFI